MTKPDIRIGISGWRYVPWRNNFYPRGLRQKDELQFASRALNSIEINGSFYGLQTPTSYANWYADTPEDFIFSVKAPRYITHIKRLRDVESPIANFFASGVLRLQDKLGPILWQFPPSFSFDQHQFQQFLELLPMDTLAAHKCAKHHETNIKNPDLQKPPLKPLRHAVEIRNHSFNSEPFVELLRSRQVALVVADTAGRWPQMEDVTSDFMYLRLHGDTELYRSGYSAKALEYWYQRIKNWSEGAQPNDAKLTSSHPAKAQRKRDVYCYFDNTDKLWAPYDARKILAKFDRLKTLTTEPGKLPDQYQTRQAKNTPLQHDLWS